MKIINTNAKEATISISNAELLILNNALNEICNGIDIFEFETRIGTNRENATDILKKIGSLLDQMESL